MNRDKATLHLFTENVIGCLTGKSVSHVNSVLVCLQYDGTARLLKAQDSSALKEVGNLNMENSSYHCWKLFDDTTLAEQFLNRLTKADMSVHLPPNPSKISAER